LTRTRPWFAKRNNSLVFSKRPWRAWKQLRLEDITARERQDALLVHIADFIRADERTHVRKGTHILKCMTTLGAQELELRTRQLFTECLVSLGAVKSDMDVFTVSREDIEQLVGE
jgi:hypothetical protein